MNNINLELYKLTQEKLFEYLKDFLNKNNVDFKIIDNQIISLNHINTPCFFSHMDTVNDSDMKKELIITENKISRKNGVLGGDDRAGINIILNHCKDINFIFTRDEEIGCVGISNLVEKFNLIELLEQVKTTCCVELDRKGNNDIIGFEHGYCGLDLVQDLEEVLNYKDTFGVLTDIDEVCNYIPSVNLSIGYYNAHGVNEYLDIKDFNYINGKIMDIVKITSNVQYEKIENNKYFFGDNSYFGDICSNCGETEKTYKVGAINTYLCKDCINDLFFELDYILTEEIKEY